MSSRSEMLSPANLVRRGRLSGPFTGEHLERVLLANAVGLVLVGITWYQTRVHGLALHTSLAWMNLGLLGIGIAGVANGNWLLRQRQILTMARVAILPEGLVSETTDGSAGSLSPGGLVSVPGMSRYHRPACPLVIGKAVETVAPSASHGLRACEVCEPEG